MNVYFAASIYERNSFKDEVDSTKNFHLELFKVSKEEQIEIKISDENKFLSKVQLKLDGNYVYCVGLYSNVKNNFVNGTFYYKYNSNDLEKKAKQFTPFTEAVLNKKYNNKKRR